MRVAQILASKGREVVTIPSSASIHEAAQELARHRIGALVVTDDGATVAGIISERDVVRTLGQESPDLAARVADAMTSTVHTCGDDETVDALMVQMTERRIRHVPVVNDGRLEGMISIGDVVKQRTRELEVESEALRDYVTGSNY